MNEPHDRNVYVWGAGFSANAGAPLIRDFLDRSREFLLDPTSSLDEMERSQFKEVFDFRQQVAQAREKVILDLDNIEHLFGLIEISERLLGSNQTRISMQYLIVKTLQLATTWPRWRRPVIRFDAKPDPQTLQQLGNHPAAFRSEAGNTFSSDMYDFFAALICGQLDDPEVRTGRRDSVITFNYDLVLEHALERSGIIPDYYLPPQLARQDSRPPNAPSLTILKLHGSANWAVCTKCQESVIVLESKVTENPNLLRSLSCAKCSAESYHPLLIPPSWDKSEYREVTRTIWTGALEELKSATRICVVGYSMPEVDAFFRYLITLSLSQNQRLFKFIVVDLPQTPREPATLDISDELLPVRFVDLPQTPREPAIAGGLESMEKSLQQKYKELLDPVFYKRRFVMYDNGLAQFLTGPARSELGRGSIVQAIFGYS